MLVVLITTGWQLVTMNTVSGTQVSYLSILKVSWLKGSLGPQVSCLSRCPVLLQCCAYHVLYLYILGKELAVHYSQHTTKGSCEFSLSWLAMICGPLYAVLSLTWLHHLVLRRHSWWCTCCALTTHRRWQTWSTRAMPSTRKNSNN